MNKSERDRRKQQIIYIKRNINFIKSDLIKSSQALRELSNKEADKLDSIIGRLEAWQNRR